MSPEALLGCENFSDLPCFWWPCWGALVRHFLSVYQLGFVWCFFSWLWVLGRKITDVKCHFHHIVSRVHTINMTYHCWCWPQSLGWGSACQSSPLETVFFPSFHILLLEGSCCTQPKLKGGSYTPPPYGKNNYTNYLELCSGDWSCLPFIFKSNYLFISVQLVLLSNDCALIPKFLSTTWKCFNTKWSV